MQVFAKRNCSLKRYQSGISLAYAKEKHREPNHEEITCTNEDGNFHDYNPCQKLLKHPAPLINVAMFDQEKQDLFPLEYNIERGKGV